MQALGTIILDRRIVITITQELGFPNAKLSSWYGSRLLRAITVCSQLNNAFSALFKEANGLLDRVAELMLFHESDPDFIRTAFETIEQLFTPQSNETSAINVAELEFIEYLTIKYRCCKSGVDKLMEHILPPVSTSSIDRISVLIVSTFNKYSMNGPVISMGLRALASLITSTGNRFDKFDNPFPVRVNAVSLLSTLAHMIQHECIMNDAAIARSVLMSINRIHEITSTVPSPLLISKVCSLLSVHKRNLVADDALKLLVTCIENFEDAFSDPIILSMAKALVSYLSLPDYATMKNAASTIIGSGHMLARAFALLGWLLRPHSNCPNSMSGIIVSIILKSNVHVVVTNITTSALSIVTKRRTKVDAGIRDTLMATIIGGLYVVMDLVKFYKLYKKSSRIYKGALDDLSLCVLKALSLVADTRLSFHDDICAVVELAMESVALFVADNEAIVKKLYYSADMSLLLRGVLTKIGIAKLHVAYSVCQFVHNVFKCSNSVSILGIAKVLLAVLRGHCIIRLRTSLPAVTSTSRITPSLLAAKGLAALACIAIDSAGAEELIREGADTLVLDLMRVYLTPAAAITAAASTNKGGSRSNSNSDEYPSNSRKRKHGEKIIYPIGEQISEIPHASSPACSQEEASSIALEGSWAIVNLLDERTRLGFLARGCEQVLMELVVHGLGISESARAKAREALEGLHML